MGVEEAVAFARTLTAGRSAVGVALTRQMLWRNPAGSPFDAHLIESLAILAAQGRDGSEGVRAFREKRAPRFGAAASEMPEFYPWWR